MFDIGFSELLLIAVVSLVVVGPKRLPETVRFAGFWVGRLRRNLHRARADMEREFGLDEVRRELYNQELLGRLADQRVRNQLENERLAVGERINDPLPGSATGDRRQPDLFAEPEDAIEWVTPEPGAAPPLIDPEPRSRTLDDALNLDMPPAVITELATGTAESPPAPRPTRH